MSATHIKLVGSKSDLSSDRKISGSIAAAVARPIGASESDGGSSGREISPVLMMICDWRMERGAFQKADALLDRSTNFGTRDAADNVPNGSCELENMRSIMALIATAQPDTIAEAREMLRATIEVLAWREVNPDSPLAQGSVLEIVRNVWHSLDRTDGEIRLAGDGASDDPAGKGG